MNLKRYIKWFSLICCILLLTAGCSDDKEETSWAGSGYLQVHLLKAGVTKAVTGQKLDYLNEAKKISVILLHENRTIIQTLPLNAVSDQAAEYGLTSEKLQLRAGSYILTGYRLYGDKVVNNQAELLQEVIPDEPMTFDITANHISRMDLTALTQLRGKVAFVLDKDFSAVEIPNITKSLVEGAIEQEEELFNYRDVYAMEVFYYKDKGQKPASFLFKTNFEKNKNILSTDTLALPVGKYTISQIRLYNKDLKKLLLAQDLEQTFEVKDISLQNITRDSIPMLQPANAHIIKEAIALYNIWQTMDGPNWGFVGESYTNGTNWIFENRPVDEWALQPGVDLKSNGRVLAINLGGFNPKGEVPEAIGVFTEMEQLWLGTHSEESIYPIDIEDMKTVDTYTLHRNGIDLRKKRMEIAKERMAVRHPLRATSDMMRGYFAEIATPTKYTTTYANNVGTLSNRITGISDAIRNCKALTSLYIANNLITELPEGLGELSNLEDLEIYNTRLTKLDECLSKLPVVSLNLSHNRYLSAEALHDGLKMMFDSNMQNTLQILYCTNNNLKKIPSNIKNVTKIGLLDLANNKIEGELEQWGRDVAPVQLFLDNNKITAIPDDLCNFDDMETFSVSYNQLTTFPKISSSESLYNLLSVDFSYNQIETFSDNFAGVYVETLNLSGNKLGKRSKVMPRTLSDTNSKINYLMMTNNDLEKVHKSSIKNFRNLVALDLSGNRLDSLTNEFGPEMFPYLSGVELSYNAFKRFPWQVLYVTSLNQLYVGHQFDNNEKRCLKEWPDNIEKHFTLRVLYLQGNDIRKTSNNFPILLNKLDVSDNPNIELNIPSDICARIIKGTFLIGYDVTQNITGCPQLGIEN